jgi:hypothetical protein
LDMDGLDRASTERPLPQDFTACLLDGFSVSTCRVVSLALYAAWTGTGLGLGTPIFMVERHTNRRFRHGDSLRGWAAFGTTDQSRTRRSTEPLTPREF